jgi:hypothetical protein
MRSSEAAIRRSKTFRARLKREKDYRKRFTENAQGPLVEARLFPFSPGDVGKFLEFLAGMVRESGEKNRLREAIGIMVSLLDPVSCWLTHCEHCWSSAPMNCTAGKNPHTCPKANAYREKKNADHAECQPCQYRTSLNPDIVKRGFFKGYFCEAKRNSDRPQYCPKLKKEGIECT